MCKAQRIIHKRVNMMKLFMRYRKRVAGMGIQESIIAYSDRMDMARNRSTGDSWQVGEAAGSGRRN